MYQVNVGNKILYYPGNSEYAIYDTELNEEVGISGEFTFKVPPQNPLYTSIVQSAIITILRDGVEYWRGEVKEIDIDIDNIAEVYCVEDLTWLSDEYLPPVEIKTETYMQRFQAAITAYNQSRPAERQFTVGQLTNVGSSSMCVWQTEYDWSILDDLRQNICKDSGYLRVRRVTSGSSVTRYIDIVRLEDYGQQTTQPIEYGYNLMNYVKESDCQNLVNVLTPLGDELDEELYPDYSQRLQGTTISDAASISSYGRHAKAVIFNGVTELSTLNALAQSYLTRYSQPVLTMEVEAVDLASVENVGAINIGDSVRIIAVPFAIDQWLYLTQIKRDLQNIEKNTITLSGRVQHSSTITSQTVDTAEMIKNLPSKASIVEAAKKNALEILNGENGGVIYFVSNDQNQIIEQVITNHIDLDQATKAWRWNLNGLAYMHRTQPSADWQVGVAITMEGQIVADYITTGTLNANNVRVVGKIEATSGYIGTQNQGWNIGSKAIYNGPSSISDTSTPGMYVGADGIRTNGTHMGLPGASTLIQSGYIDSNSEVKCGVLTAGSGLFTGSLTVKSAFQIGTSSILSEITGRFNNVNGMVIQSTPDSATFAFLHSLTNGTSANRWVPWTSASDRRLKENIKPIEADFARAFFDKVNPVSFNFIADEDKKTEYGLIAQELEEVFEDLGETNENIIIELEGEEQYKAINYEKLVGILIPAVKDLYAQINELKEEIKILKEERNG